jgi:MFS family permease
VLWFCITGVVQHQALYLGRDQGLSTEVLGNVFSLFFTCSVLGKFIFGWLSDHFPKFLIMLLAIVNLAAGLVILRFVDGAGIAMIYGYAVVFGIGFSGSFTMIQLTIAELFTGPTYGRILGIYVAVDTIAASAGIFALGTIRVAADSYIPAIDLMLFLSVVALACVLAIKRELAKRELQIAAAE